jgi:electron transfer flavoprotein beta subunit
VKIAVLIKQVPDSDDVRMDPETGTMVREGMGAIVNPLDLNALQAALDLRSAAGGEVTVITMGPPRAHEALRECLSMGADRGMLLTDRAFAGSDTWATAKVLAAAVKKAGPFDLVLAGEKATDGETGQVGPETAALLGMPFSTYVSALSLADGGVKVARTVEEGIQRQFLPFPCLLTVLHALNEPSMPTLAGKKRARRTEIPLEGIASIGISPEETGLGGSATRVVKISYPTISRTTEMFDEKRIDEGIERLVAVLRDMAVI